MTMEVYNGTSWETKQRVFLGEAETDGSSVTDVTTYALRGQYLSEWFSVSTNSNYTKNHNLGVTLDLSTVNYSCSMSANGAEAATCNDYYRDNGVGIGYYPKQNTTYVSRLTTYLGFLERTFLYKGSSKTSGYLRLYINRNF